MTVAELARMQAALTCGLPFDAGRFGDDARALWDALAVEVAELRAQGFIVDLPHEIPEFC